MTASECIELWIQFLKKSQVVRKVDAATGKLVYRRSPTESDLRRFMQVKCHLADREIDEIVASVVGIRAAVHAADADGAFVERPGPDLDEGDVRRAFRLVEEAHGQQRRAQQESEQALQQQQAERAAQALALQAREAIEGHMDKHQRLVFANLVDALVGGAAILPTARIRNVFAALSTGPRRTGLFAFFPANNGGPTLASLESRWCAEGLPIEWSALRAFLVQSGLDAPRIDAAYAGSASFDEALDFDEPYCPLALVKIARHVLQHVGEAEIRGLVDCARGR